MIELIVLKLIVAMHGNSETLIPADPSGQYWNAFHISLESGWTNIGFKKGDFRVTIKNKTGLVFTVNALLVSREPFPTSPSTVKEHKSPTGGVKRWTDSNGWNSGRAETLNKRGLFLHIERFKGKSYIAGTYLGKNIGRQQMKEIENMILSVRISDAAPKTQIKLKDHQPGNSELIQKSQIR
ncbi:MAG: hypothetical protein K8R88_06935 [Armatimonadetes bacterium]|nr:hypothetical protein [Armatimonadota bacterium]